MSPKRRANQKESAPKQTICHRKNFPNQGKEPNRASPLQDNNGSDSSTTFGNYDVLPAKTIWLVHLVTVFTRAAMAADKGNWWILHPDEVFQTVEIAHSEVYGYGFRPYEYLPPPAFNTTHIPDQQRAALGMYSLRSFLLPRIFMALFYVKEQLGLKTNPFLMAKIFHAITAAHLPLAVFYFLRHIVESRDIKTLASVLVAASEHLIVLGTHPIVNSFLAPFTFFTLGWFLQLICASKRLTTGEDDVSHVCSLPHLLNEKPNNALNSKECHGSMVIRSSSKAFRIGKECETGCVNNNDENYHIGECQDIPRHIASFDQGNIAYKMPLWFNGRTSRETSCTFNQWQVQEMLPLLRRITCGLLFGILMYIRVDLTLFIGSVIFSFYVSVNLTGVRSMCNDLALYAVGGCIGIILGGWDDYTCYGVWFISPYQWFKFNVYRDLSTTIFGKGDFIYYFREVFLRDGYSMTLCLANAIALVTCVVVKWRKLHYVQASKPLLRFTLVYVSLVIFYSAKGHKEVRFVHNVIVIYLVISAISIDIIINLICILFNSSVSKTLLYTIIVISSFWHMSLRFQNPNDKDITRWSFQGTKDSFHVNNCLDFIGQQEDVTGIYVDRTIHMTGGYSVLHKNVPIVALIHYEYYEFGNLARQYLPSHSRFRITTTRDISVSVLSQISNFFTVENRNLLVKHIFEHSEYNFAVTESNKTILEYGFKNVFSSGPLQVLKRNTEKDSEKTLLSYGSQIPIGTNSTVLEFEGSWLYTFGLYHKAIWRLEGALRLDRTRVKVYQILSMSYGAVENERAANQVFAQCIKLHGQKCSQPQPRVVLHSDVNIQTDKR